MNDDLGLNGKNFIINGCNTVNDYNSEKLVLLIDERHEAKRLDLVLTSIYGIISRSKIQNWILLGAVRLNGCKVKSSTIVKIGQIVEVNPPPQKESSWESENIPLDVVHEDSSIIIINKPSSLVVHPGAGNTNGTLLNALIFHFPILKSIPRAGLVHRLDKDTSGLILIAKTIESYQNLVLQLQHRSVQRIYYAVTWGRLMCEKKLIQAIARNRNDRKRFSVSNSSFAKYAETHFIPMAQGNIENYTVSLIECKLKTGRTHQIRVHLEHLKLPIIGDQTYKKRAPFFQGKSIERQALHARCLSFSHPETNIKVQFHSELPDDFNNLLLIAGIK